MWQLSEAIDGMGEACRALGLRSSAATSASTTSRRGRDIDPTPVVGMLGARRRAAIAGRRAWRSTRGIGSSC